MSGTADLLQASERRAGAVKRDVAQARGRSLSASGWSDWPGKCAADFAVACRVS